METNQVVVFISGIATGVVMGSIAASLLAPKNGKETRNEIVVKSQDWQQKAKDTKEDVTTRTEAWATSMKDRKDRVSSTVKEQAKTVSDRAKQAVESTSREWKDVKEESLLAASNTREGIQEEKERLKQDIDQEIQEAKQKPSSPTSTSDPSQD
ncbi:YtxH domain-containing protein [Marinococcus halotolerans]|uniref:YtxH domain-containing protein n=1 Tax=Marinococcus halotolerans TaxID=301092 RepID=UPI0003B5671A|nr:YtxH domain-containing protein [Marinococcus halotolerans]